ncbi:phosphate ABC transporter substrate-binding protein PstS [Thiohalocapsa marina]|uniref:Phosphate-binding protein PstS n=1 Tax=Thiohalocapsa marina TaxID=424902 RepID=A0A5M8FLA6_9GAMM|nr:phosphate ABC transporter substrate-binding protein PstS [Thiohalocapsa marina]KAA6185539.1 phosphate ABC transporter substrate-binding protein PstS [Thiohalocapsa marina]
MTSPRLFTSAALVGSVVAMLSAPAAFADVKLNGSGASFPAPIYAKWFKDFSKETKGIRVDYQSKGSGAGIQDLINGVVDFAGSDAAMNDEEIAKVEQGVVLLPMTAGEVVIAYNLEGVDELRLPRDVYPAIFGGTITRWNDPKIVAANPGVELPDEAITVVVRSDSSGTSYVFTGHLSAVSEEFKNTVGKAKAPNWPSSDKIIKAPKNDGVTAQIKQIPGSIGYIEYGFAKLTGQPTALLENQQGKFIAPGPEGGAATLASIRFPDATLPVSGAPDLRAWAWDPEGADDYPIVSMTWLLLYHDQDDDKAEALHKLVNYLTSDEAQGQADGLGYIPLPAAVTEKVQAALSFVK